MLLILPQQIRLIAAARALWVGLAAAQGKNNAKSAVRACTQMSTDPRFVRLALGDVTTLCAAPPLCPHVSFVARENTTKSRGVLALATASIAMQGYGRALPVQPVPAHARLVWPGDMGRAPQRFQRASAWVVARENTMSRSLRTPRTIARRARLDTPRIHQEAPSACRACLVEPKRKKMRRLASYAEVASTSPRLRHLSVLPVMRATTRPSKALPSAKRAKPVGTSTRLGKMCAVRVRRVRSQKPALSTRQAVCFVPWVISNPSSQAQTVKRVVLDDTNQRWGNRAAPDARRGCSPRREPPTRLFARLALLVFFNQKSRARSA